MFSSDNLSIELNALNEIEQLSERYQKKYGHTPFDVSHWDPSEEFKSKVANHLLLPNQAEAINYSFSWTLKNRLELFNSFNFNDSMHGCLITPSGSVSILCMVQWLKLKGYKEVKVICPTYFTLLNNCRNLGIKVDKKFLIRKGREYHIPQSLSKDIKLGDTVWFTNPVYCTGVAYNDDAIFTMIQLLERGVRVIVDECLAPRGSELSQKLAQYPLFMGIYAPHKTICVNGYKFSLITFPKEDQDLMDMWSDPIFGCLSASNIIAVNHYLNRNFSTYAELIKNKNGNTRKIINELVNYFSNVNTDLDPIGYLQTLYFPKIDFSKSIDNDFLWYIIENTAGIFTPGQSNHFSDSIGFCFRVNLMRDSPQFRATLFRLLKILNDFRE